MYTPSRPPAARSLLAPTAPFDVAILGAGRVGGSFAAALTRAGHRVVARLKRADDPAAIASADVVVIAVPDDALEDAAATAARLARPDAVLLHTCGLAGLEPLRAHGGLIAAIHPAVPVATPDQALDGVVFGVTCPDELRAWCAAFVSDLGGEPLFLFEEQRALYHAALAMASNFAVTLAGDAGDLLGRNDVVTALLRATVDNIARLGPDAALTGPVVRGDAGTVRAHLRALPADLLEMYVANARRTLQRARRSGRLGDERAEMVEQALDEAAQR